MLGLGGHLLRNTTAVLASVLTTQASAGDQLTFSCDGTVRDRKSLDERPVRGEILEINTADAVMVWRGLRLLFDDENFSREERVWNFVATLHSPELVVLTASFDRITGRAWITRAEDAVVKKDPTYKPWETHQMLGKTYEYRGKEFDLTCKQVKPLF